MSGPACLAGSAGLAEAPSASAGPRRLGLVGVTSALAFVLALSGEPVAAQTTDPAVIVPDFDAALVTGQPYPSQLTVAGRGIVEDVNLRISRLYHELPSELDILLVGPGGESTVILSDVGASAPITGGHFVFDDEAAGPASDLMLSGTYRPTDLLDGPPDVFPAPAPAGPYGSTLSVFDNSVADGVWSLYVVDDTPFDGGQITGVSLSINGRPARSLSPNADPSTITEGPGTVATIRVQRSLPGGAATVGYVADAATSDAPAAPGRDFEPVSGTLTFAPGETEKTISVPIADDDRFELSEKLSVTLAGPRGDAALAARTFATVTIRDDDKPSLRLQARRVQRPLRVGGVTVSARSSGGSRIVARGTVALPGNSRIQLVGARGRTVAGRPTRLVLRLRRPGRRKLTAAFEKRRRLKARITVSAENDGRSTVAAYRVKLRR